MLSVLIDKFYLCGDLFGLSDSEREPALCNSELLDIAVLYIPGSREVNYRTLSKRDRLAVYHLIRHYIYPEILPCVYLLAVYTGYGRFRDSVLRNGLDWLFDLLVKLFIIKISILYITCSCLFLSRLNTYGIGILGFRLNPILYFASESPS